MSYEEFARDANRYHYIHYSELMFGDKTKHMNTTQDDQIFEIPLLGAKSDTQKHPSVKGGDIDKNTAIRYPKSTPKCGRHTQNE